MTHESRQVRVLVVAVPETAGSALYGMIDVLGAAGNIWEQLVELDPGRRAFTIDIVSEDGRPFACANHIPVQPRLSALKDPPADIIIIPELWLGPDDTVGQDYPALLGWIRESYRKGAFVYSACSGAILLAETGLLSGKPATSHWAYERQFRTRFPDVEFKVEPALQFADPAGRIVTAGGTTSWHDLALHIIARHCSPGEALRIAKVYLLKTHPEGQLPYAALVKDAPHADSVVRRCEELLRKEFLTDNPVRSAVAGAGIPERTLKRRFKSATGLTLIDYVQNLRIEHAKRLLETSGEAVDEVAAAAGYDNPSFFRRLFKRRCGLAPAEYRRLFASPR
ncbi:MAG TPA: helix-turn-helix domain-containing protein [Sphingomicrobium sp.]